MADLILQHKLYPYDGEQDATKHPLFISSIDITDSDNIVYTTYSTKKLRPGLTGVFDQKISGNNSLLGIFDFHRYGQDQRLVWWDGFRLYAAGRDGIRYDITGNMSLPQGEAVSFEKINGLLFIFFQDGLTLPKYWTGTGSIQELSGSGVVKSKFGRVFFNALWLADPEVPGRLVKSKTGDPTDFSTGDSAVYDLDVNDGDPDGITAIFPPLFKKLYVSKRLSIYEVTPTFNPDGDLIFSPAKMVDGVGSNCHNAVVAVESDIFFTSDRGVHSLQQTDKVSGVETGYLSINIQNLWREDINFIRARYMWAHYDRDLNSYIVLFPPIGSSNVIDAWGFNIVVGKLYRWRDYNQTCICRWIDFSTKKLRTVLGSLTGDIGYIDSEVKSDYGKKYKLLLQSGIIAPSGTLDDQYRFQFISPIFVPQTSGSFSLYYFINGQLIERLVFDMSNQNFGDRLGEEFELAFSRLGSYAQFKVDKRTIMGYGMTYQFYIEFDPAQQDEEVDFELLGLIFDVGESVKSTGQAVG